MAGTPGSPRGQETAWIAGNRVPASHPALRARPTRHLPPCDPLGGTIGGVPDGTELHRQTCPQVQAGFDFARFPQQQARVDFEPQHDDWARRQQAPAPLGAAASVREATACWLPHPQPRGGIAPQGTSTAASQTKPWLAVVLNQRRFTDYLLAEMASRSILDQDEITDNTHTTAESPGFCLV